METQLYSVENDTNQVYVIYDVGRFVPGSTEIELNEEQVQLMKDNAILKTSKVSKTQKPATKSEKVEKSDDAGKTSAKESVKNSDDSSDENKEQKA
jgi:hypothetical protein